MTTLWVEYLTAIEDLRIGIGLQAYGQRDPLVSFKTEGYRMFQQLQRNILHDIAHTIFHVTLIQQVPETNVFANATTNRGRRRGWWQQGKAGEGRRER